MKVKLITTMLLIIFSGNVLAWGNSGHKIICQIAWERLSDEGKKFVKTALINYRSSIKTSSSDKNADSRPMTFQDGCLWADESRRDTFRGTYEYHYLNISKDHKEYVFHRDCAARDCITVGIQRYAQYLTLPPSKRSNKEKIILGLRFLGHFVGDLHQPLHVGFTEDIGGNSIYIHSKYDSKNKKRSLHSVWDGQILQVNGLKRQNQGKDLAREITSQETKEWLNFNVHEWAEESYQLSLSHAYLHRPNGKFIRSGDRLEDEYFIRNFPAAKKRLKQAGARLAHLIESAALGTLPIDLLTFEPGDD